MLMKKGVTLMLQIRNDATNQKLSVKRVSIKKFEVTKDTLKKILIKMFSLYKQGLLVA